MSAHAKKQPEIGPLLLGDRARPVITVAAGAATAGLAASVILGRIGDSYGSFSRFFFAYLFAYAFFLSLGLGALFFLLMGYLTRTGWAVGIRRVTESIAGTIPVMGILAIPIIISIAMDNGSLYRWALPLSAASPEAVALAKAHEEEPAPEVKPADASKVAPVESVAAIRGKLDANTLQKRAFLNPFFFILRLVIYFAIWSFIAIWYRKQSLLQDQTGDWRITVGLQRMSGALVVLLGLSITFAAWDLFMSLDPHWFSTMWGVYYFAGSALAFFACCIIVVSILKRAGYLKIVTKEHYHDLGKYLFGFTFFWGYIAFSQYMLLWYANIPEEIQWLARHGATTVHAQIGAWTWVILAILFGQLLIPFAGVMSRHVKRRPAVLTAWAVWVLVFHALDTYWIVLPEYGPFKAWTIVVDLCAFVGIGGIFVATVVRNLAPNNLVPMADPRLSESLVFQNI